MINNNVYINYNYSENLQIFQNFKRIGHLGTLSLLPYNVYVGIQNIWLTYDGKMSARCSDELYQEIKRFEIFNQKNPLLVKTICENLKLDLDDCILASKMNSLIHLIGINNAKWELTVN